MLNREENNGFLELIPRYLSGNASDKEVQELEAWVLADPENKKQFIAFKKAWILSGMKEDKQSVNVEQMWKETSKGLFEEAKLHELKPNKGRRKWLAIAASMAVIILALSLIFGGLKDDGAMAYEAKEQIENLDLPDGSKVTLNQNSSLQYEFTEDNRRAVVLEGDAFFDVKREESKPFEIKADEVSIKVLGTSFYVDGRTDEDEIQVIVKSGSVAVRAGKTEIVLKANEKAIFNKASNALAKVENDDPNFTALTTNKLVFDNTKLSDVVFALNRQFNSNISIQDDLLKNCPLTAVYENKSLTAILKVLEGSLSGIKAQQLGERIVLTGTNCN